MASLVSTDIRNVGAFTFGRSTTAKLEYSRLTLDVTMIEAKVFTRLDSRRKRSVARKIVLPELESLLGQCEQVAVISEACNVGYQDLEVRLWFPRQVDVYIDCPEKWTKSVAFKVLFLLEPEVVSQAAATAAMLAAQGKHFDCVLGHDANARHLCRGHRQRFFGVGGAWVLEKRPSPKVYAASIICGDKLDTVGHALRRLVWETAPIKVRRFKSAESQLDKGYALNPRPQDKAVAIAPYAYHVVVENVRQRGYFSEKLIDCFLLRTVPIYWGAPDLADFFDARGILAAESYEGLLAHLDSVSAADYEKRLEAIENNLRTAQDHWVNLQARMQAAIDGILKHSSDGIS